MLDIIVLTVDPETFTGCAENLATQEHMFHGIVVQNTDPFDPPKGWTVVPGSRTQNYGQSLNAAFQYLRGDRVLLVSDDARLWPGAIHAMCDHHDAVVGAVLVNKNGCCNHVGMEFLDGKWPSHLGRRTSPEDAGRCRHVEAVTWALVLIDRAAIEKVGEMDTGYMWSHEDIDYELRIREAGFGKPMLCTDAKATHNEAGVPDTPRDLVGNSKRFAKRWIETGRIDAALAPGNDE